MWNTARSIAASLIATGVLLAALPSGSAFHDDDTPLIASGGGPGGGWVSFKFTTDGARVVLDIRADGLSDRNQVGGILYDGDGSLLFGVAFTALGGSTGVLLDAHPAPGVNVHEDTYSSGTDPTQFMGLGLTLNDPEFGAPTAGTFKVLLWSAGTQDTWSWAFRGGSGTSLLATDSGSHTFLYDSRDFTGVATARASAALVAARANVDGSVSETISDTFVGVFYPVFMSVDETSADTPSGTQDCPCFQWGPNGPGAWGPGSYTFHLTGAGAGLNGLEDVLLGGADARLPA